MAKKNYLKVEAWDIEIKSKDGLVSEIKIRGANSKGTEIEMSVTCGEYMFPYMISQMAKIGKNRMDAAIMAFNRLKESVSV